MDLSHKKCLLKQVLQDKLNDGTLQPQQQPLSAAVAAAAATAQLQQQPGGSSGSSRRASQSAAGSAGDSSKCCKVCKAKQTKLMRCARCRAVKYCSAACQAEVSSLAYSVHHIASMLYYHSSKASLVMQLVVADVRTDRASEWQMHKVTNRLNQTSVAQLRSDHVRHMLLQCCMQEAHNLPLLLLLLVVVFAGLENS
jgi:hypothetical protein